ncbi:uncharacterized protein HMPREF1541_00015 [Cyphellophora europaea CBS 101466]|uniref:Uncharacterized protein n=1 Tax=Cyphellophora europaea (strain CBS 101466) TaxID=1220924 RepID=W2SD44_CYPE1|nr:uncharacterized protein HMPREF1541_00015 [Cyphellophora europaea CBS 101466]ETN45834.1 hypothetical protein HMPREF1541_00015 [Cyphellophora europaea CBS 101466]
MSMGGRLIELNERPPHRSILSSFAHLPRPHYADGSRDMHDEGEALVSSAERLDLNDEKAHPLLRPDHKDLPEDPFMSADFRHDVYVSSCILKDTRELRRLFEKYPEADFVSQSDDEGNNGVLLAATEENGAATVQWLHERGATIDQANHYGRTPLMEAALWRRLETVRYLTAQGVNVQTRDANGMSALDISLNSARNTEKLPMRIDNVPESKAI